MKICWEFIHLQAIQDIDEFVNLALNLVLRNLALQHLLTNGSSALHWMGAVRMRVQTPNKIITLNSQVVHMTPVNQLCLVKWKAAKSCL